MKLTSRWLVLVALFVACAAGSIWAGEDGHQIGVGIGLEPTRLFEVGSNIISYATTPVSIYVPINIGPSFRVEPDFGIFSFTTERTSSGYSDKDEASATRIGVGGFYLLSNDSTLCMYLGPRMGFYVVSFKSTSTFQQSSLSNVNGTSEVDFAVGLSFGGEYKVSSQFSVGGEVQLNYISFGNPSLTPAAPSSTRSQGVVGTNSLMLVRWFF